MSSRLPIVRQSSPLPAVGLYAVLIGSAGFAHVRLGPGGVVLVVGSYLLYWWIARRTLTADHRRGMLLFVEKRYREAIDAFEASYAAMERRPWIDRFRAIVLLSPSAITYREMALVNMGFCYAQLGEKERAREMYRRAIAEFPGSAIAESALRFLE